MSKPKRRPDQSIALARRRHIVHFRERLLRGCVIVFLSCFACSSPEKSPPNILLIVLDAARSDHFSCYGYRRPTTPKIDAVAGGGLLFKRAVSTSSWSPPAHASLFTGLLPDEHGVTNSHQWLVERIPTLAELLVDRGYRTAAFSNNPFVDRVQNFHQGFETFEAIWADTASNKVSRLNGAELTNRLVKKFIGETKDKPFFVFINYIDVHMPYNPSEPYRSMYLNQEVEITARIDSACRYPVSLNDGELVPVNSEESAVQSIYDGALSYLDTKVEDLVEFLRLKSLYDNTVVIITSDHGELFGEFGYYTHGGRLNRALIQIPLIVRYPPLIKKPGIREELVSITDIFHSLVQLLDLEEAAPSGVQPRNLFASHIKPQPCYSLFCVGYTLGMKLVYQHDLRSVWTPDGLHYLLAEGGEKFECYDLNRDFNELHDLYPEYYGLEKIESAVGLVRKSLIDFVETPEDLRMTKDNLVDPLHERAMRALGYVGNTEEEVKEHPHTATHIKAGIFFFRNKNYPEKAEREIRTAFSMGPDIPVVRKYLGLLYMEKGNYTEAIKVLRSTVGTFQDEKLELDVLTTLASAYIEVGNIAKAAECYERAVEINPSDANTIHLAGWMNHMLNKRQKAISYYKIVLGMDSRHLPTLVNMGLIEEEEGKPELAERYYLKALKVDSTNASVNADYGNLLMKKGKLTLAVKYFEMVLKSDPSDVAIHNALGSIYFKTGQLKEALDHYRLLASLVPEQAGELTAKYIRPIEEKMSRTSED